MVEVITIGDTFWKYAYRSSTQALISSGSLSTDPHYAAMREP